MKSTTAIAALIVGAAATSGAANAQTFGAPGADTYVSLSGGGSFLHDSRNNGALTSQFTTGAGTAVSAGTVLPEGAGVGWTTDFKPGYALSGAIGRQLGMGLRGEVELAWQRNSVKSHRGVAVALAPFDNEDIGVFTPGSPQLGQTVGDVFAGEPNRARTLYLMANALYDLDIGGPVTPYLGGGVGLGFVDVEFRPSNVLIADDSSVQFAWQAMAGASYELTPRADLFAGYRYRGTTKPTLETTFLPADVEMQKRGSVIEAGLRYAF